MGDVEYDLDTSGGIMDQIQALLAPPTSDQTVVKTNKKVNEVPKHPYYKRPGKGHNHDNCDACGEGGDLICCDKCPASFHLQCHDPPLEENDIPQGQWLCHVCRKAKAAENAATELEGSRKRLRNNRTSSVSSVSSSTPSIMPKPAKKSKTNPLEMLAQAASALNPKQFELPREYSIPCPFPGTDKVEATTYHRNGRKVTVRHNGKMPRKPHELQPGGTVPLPARTCYECSRSCRIAPLLACDYCPLLFHQDCLDPPLTAIPAGRWMCPNHVEQYIDSKLVTSVSATERIRLWDRFTGPIDQDAVKTEFIRKAHCRNPPFRVKVRLGTRCRVKVPGIVRYHYRHPVELLPSLREVRRIQTVINRLSHQGNRNDDCSIIADQIDLTNTHDKIKTVYKTDSSQDSGNASMESPFEIENKPTVGGPMEWTVNGRRTSTSECSNGSDETSSSHILAALSQDVKLPDVVSNISQDVDRELKQLDDRLVRFLAYQRIQQISDTDFNSLKVNSKPQKHMPLPSELLTPADIERISRVFLSPTKNNKASLQAETAATPATTIPIVKSVDNRIRVRAVLYPVTAKNIVDTVERIDERLPHVATMRYRSLTIGRGPGNHVDVDKYGKCNYVSSKHAIIFYDEAAQKYELINYSEHGTAVNNVLYTSDFTSKRPKATSLVSDIVEKRKPLTNQQQKSPQQQCMATISGSSIRPLCACESGVPPDLTEGWEGTAIISHGTLLRFGCISFVFSITDQAGL